MDKKNKPFCSARACVYTFVVLANGYALYVCACVVMKTKLKILQRLAKVTGLLGLLPSFT